MKVLIFKIEENDDFPFRTGLKYPLENLVKTIWDSNDSETLTKMLNLEIIKNYIWYKLIGTYCSHREHYEYGDKIPIRYRKKEFLFEEIGNDVCKNYFSSVMSYNDIFNRDEKIMSKKYKDNTYAVVLLNDDTYLGHVYVWIGPNKKYGYMMGIRSNIMSKFKGVSYYLLDAARKFFITNNVDTFVVPYPIGGMDTKLSSFGFVRETIPGELIGDVGIMSYSKSPCDRCMVKRNIKDLDISTKENYDLHIL